MRKFLLFLLLCCTLSLTAQQKKTTTTQKATTTATTGKKTQTTSKKQQPATSQKKTSTTGKKTSTPAKKNSSTGKKSTPTTKDIRKLQNEQAALQKKINESQNLLKTNRSDVKSQLANLALISGKIDEQQKYVNTIQIEVDTLTHNISVLNRELQQLEEELAECKRKYSHGVMYMYRNRLFSNKLMFIFSAKNFQQMYRRIRYAQEYTKYQRAQGRIIQKKQDAVNRKRAEILGVQTQKKNLLAQGRTQQGILEGQKRERQTVVDDLNKKQKQLQSTLAEQQRKSQQLNARIDALVQAEIKKADDRRRAEEQKRQNQQPQSQVASATPKKDTNTGKNTDKASGSGSNGKANSSKGSGNNSKGSSNGSKNSGGNSKTSSTSNKGSTSSANGSKSSGGMSTSSNTGTTGSKKGGSSTSNTQETPKKSTVTYNAPDNADRQLSSNFASNQGRLPVPITGSYVISSHFGSYTPDGLSGVTLDNKGINITGKSGAQARCVFDGEVSAVFSIGGMTNIIVRHGSYMSVYCNLSSASVRQGQKVSARQNLGPVARDASGNVTLHFQLRKETAKLNPESWIGR